MSSGIILLMFISGFFVGLVICYFVYRTPIKIEFKISAYNRFLYSVIVFSLIMAIMMLELIFYEKLLSFFHPKEWKLIVLYYAIEGGLIVVIALPIMSIIFDKLAKSFNFDLAGAYSINIIKMYYSASIIANCIWLLIMHKSKIVDNDPEIRCIISRVVIWILNVVGTWAGIGFRCEGRIYEEWRNIIRSRKTTTAKETFVFCIPFIIAFIMNCFFLIVQAWDIKWIQNIFLAIYLFVFGMIIAMFLLIMILNYFKCPSDKRSNRKLSIAINKINKNLGSDEITGYYGTLRYHLIKKDGKKILKIEEGNVIWSGNEERIKGCFGVREKEFDRFEYETCQDYLKTEREKRRRFIRNAFIECEEKQRKQLVKEKV